MRTVNPNQAHRQSCAAPLAVVLGAARRYVSAHPETGLGNEDMGLDVPIKPVPPSQPLQPDTGTKLVDPDKTDVPR